MIEKEGETLEKKKNTKLNEILRFRPWLWT